MSSRQLPKNKLRVTIKKIVNDFFSKSQKTIQWGSRVGNTCNMVRYQVPHTYTYLYYLYIDTSLLENLSNKEELQELLNQSGTNIIIRGWSRGPTAQ